MSIGSVARANPSRGDYFLPFAVSGVVALLLASVLVWLIWFQKPGAAVQSAGFDVLRTQEDAWNRGDLNGFVGTYQMSDAITFYGGGRITNGWANLLERYQRRYQTAGTNTDLGRLKFDDVVVEPMSSDGLLARGKWTVTLNDRASTGLFTILVKRFPEGWRVVHDHTSSECP